MIITRLTGDELTQDYLADLINKFNSGLFEKLGQPKILVSRSQAIFDPKEASEFVECRKLSEDQKMELKRYIKEGKNFGCDGFVYIPRVKLLIEDREIIIKVAGARRMLHPFIFRDFISLFRFDCAARYLVTHSNYPNMPSNIKSLFDCVWHLQEIHEDMKNICSYLKVNPEQFRIAETESIEEYIHKLGRNVSGSVKYDFDGKTVVEEDLSGMELFLTYYNQVRGNIGLIYNFVGESISKYKKMFK